ncbi:hypothetical protein TCON_0943 [Astathelohania contejeani]|uniref:Uncharacterized protein n=1 Tax=Astathelohania contejeani TaxID=164912 RepID=A0ABQ7I069_9MICR|nr:hypothetical protein TCON_0943 [Thelohania contejeani]
MEIFSQLSGEDVKADTDYILLYLYKLPKYKTQVKFNHQLIEYLKQKDPKLYSKIFNTILDTFGSIPKNRTDKYFHLIGLLIRNFYMENSLEFFYTLKCPLELKIYILKLVIKNGCDQKWLIDTIAKCEHPALLSIFVDNSEIFDNKTALFEVAKRKDIFKFNREAIYKILKKK